jgi:hypothetical protein
MSQPDCDECRQFRAEAQASFEAIQDAREALTLTAKTSSDYSHRSQDSSRRAGDCIMRRFASVLMRGRTTHEVRCAASPAPSADRVHRVPVSVERSSLPW